MVGGIDIIAINNTQVVIFLKNEIGIEIFFSFFASWQYYYYIIIKMFMHMCAIRGIKRNLIHVLT